MTAPREASHLLSEPPMLIYPTLAKLLGINKAVMFQQLHFLLNTTKTARNTHNFIDERWWVYNSYGQWRQDHFVWLSESSIKNLFTQLEADGLVLSRQGVKTPADRRKWYTIDYEAWEKFCLTMRQNLSDGTSDKNCLMVGQKLSDDSSDTTSETPSESDATPARTQFKVKVYGGQDTYADGRFIDPMNGEFEAACNHIFYAWLDGLALVGRKPDTAPDELWSQNYTATTALAKNRRTPEQIAGYVAYVYGDEADDFYKNIPTPIKLMAVANGLPGWLHDQQIKDSEVQQQRARRQQTANQQDELTPEERAEMFKQAREQLETPR